MAEGFDFSTFQPVQSEGLDFQSAGLNFQSAGLVFQSAGLNFQSAGLDFQSAGLDFQSAELEVLQAVSANSPLKARFVPEDIFPLGHKELEKPPVLY